MRELILGNNISYTKIVSIDARNTVGEEKSSVWILRGDSLSRSNGIDATSTEFQ